jgi:predicted metal-binding membrane protein
MGRLLVILLVVLIPLRGWSAERMVIQMAYSQTVAEVADAQMSMDGMPADCPMLAQAESKSDKPISPAKGFAGCQTCQLCMTLASSSFPQIQPAAHRTEVHPDPAGDSFSSADLALRVKPPIL